MEHIFLALEYNFILGAGGSRDMAHTLWQTHQRIKRMNIEELTSFEQFLRVVIKCYSGYYLKRKRLPGLAGPPFIIHFLEERLFRPEGFFSLEIIDTVN